MRKLLCLLMTLITVITLLSPLGVNAVELPFDDVKSSNWYYNSVLVSYKNGIMKGQSQTKFAPNSKMTRAELVTMLSNLLNADVSGMKENALAYSDIKGTEWYADYVGWGAVTGLVKGYEDNTFKATENVTRAELAVLFERFLEYIDVSFEGDYGEYKDSLSIPKWAKSDIDKIRITGLIKGDDNGNFNPQKNTTRAEVATIASRLINNTQYKKATGKISESDPIGENIGYQYNQKGFSISYSVELKNNETTIPVSGTGAHGGHESKVLRTEHGTYCVYVNGEHNDSQYNFVWDEFKIMKILPDGVKILGEYSYPHSNGSCTPNIFAGKDGTVYVSVISVDNPKYYSQSLREGAYLQIYELNEETEKITVHSSNPDFKIMYVHGYGYSQPVPDIENGKIYALYTGGIIPGYLAWFIYDIETGTWDTTCHTIKNDYRISYFNAYADGNGGFYFISQRNVLVSDFADAYGLDGILRVTNGYMWDALYIYSIADAYIDKAECVSTIYEPDYEGLYNKKASSSKTTIKGVSATSATHYGSGCSYLDNGILYIVWSLKESSPSVTMMLSAYDTKTWECLYNDSFSLTYSNSYTFAMGKGKDGDLYLIGYYNGSPVKSANLEIWKINDDFSLTQKVPTVILTTPDGNAINAKASSYDTKIIMTSVRNGSLEDGTVGIIYYSTGDNNINRYMYCSIELP